jgi:predicted DCC family thiol-disulfide oxidoreductase YuxK
MYPYSDGSPFYELGVAVTLLMGFGFIALTPVGHSCDSIARQLASSLRRSGLFSSTITLAAEIRRLDLLRVIIGVMATWHYAPEVADALTVGNSANAFWFGLTTLLTAFVAIGFATPIAATMLLLFLNTLVVNLTLDISIGSLAIAICLIPIMVAPSGHSLSIDAVLLRYCPTVRAVYRLWGRPTIDRIQISRFLALVAFCAINFYSASSHLESQTWRDGLTTGTILLFPVIDPSYYKVADAIYARAPMLYVLWSEFTTYGMLIWQIFLLPLVLISRWTRIAAIIWGVIFFVFSAHVLHIKTLGVYEYVLFIFVFWSHTWIDGRGRHAMTIVFDDGCNLCNGTVKALAWIDLFDRLEFRPLSQNTEFARQHGVSEDEALIDLVGVSPNGQIARGYDLYLQIAGRVLLIVPLWPILFIGGLMRVGPMAYRFIADRRRRLFGVCEPGRYQPRAAWAPIIARESSTIFIAVLLTFAALLGAYLLRAPVIAAWAPPLAAGSTTAFGSSPSVFGIGIINVFNEADLKLYHNTAKTGFVTTNGTGVPMAFSFSEAVNSLLTEDLRIAARSPVFCSESWGDHIARYYADILTPSDPARNFLIRTEFLISTHPSREDMLHFRYAPPTWQPACTTLASISNPAIRTVERNAADKSQPHQPTPASNDRQ